MSNSAELDELKKEVAALKEQLRELRSFFNIQPVEDKPGRKSMLINCSGIFLQNPDDPDKSQGFLYATAEGPALSLWGDDQQARIMIDVEKNKGRIQLFQEGLKQIVDIGLDGNNNPQVGVLHEGKPRAVLKATADMGAVSAVHDDGLVRAFLIGKSDHGEVEVVGGDMKAAVKLSADGMDGSGYITVNHVNGKAALILAGTHLGGGIISNNSLGQQLATWPHTQDGGDADEE